MVYLALFFVDSLLSKYQICVVLFARPMATTRAPKLAATVVVAVREGSGYKVLMVKRKGGARFMPSVHVFPGMCGDCDNDCVFLCVLVML